MAKICLDKLPLRESAELLQQITFGASSDGREVTAYDLLRFVQHLPDISSFPPELQADVQAIKQVTTRYLGIQHSLPRRGRPKF